MANEIIITVQNQIQQQEQVAGQVGIQTPSASAKKKQADGFLGAIDAQFLVRGANRLLSATGNTEISSAIGKVARYGFMTARALLPPNPIGIATLALSISADALNKITDDIRKRAAAENEVDNARIKAGLLDVTDVRIQSNWFSGKQTYRRV
jgi:hypothetical protein